MSAHKIGIFAVKNLVLERKQLPVGAKSTLHYFWTIKYWQLKAGEAVLKPLQTFFAP
jgi:hypothetical protein